MNCERCQRPLEAVACGTVCHVCLAALAQAPWLDLRHDGGLDVPASPPERAAVCAQRFGDYELLEVIAHGGMGVVYRARQISLGRIVALKMIRAGVLASEIDISRFRAEARAAAGLHHPHIIAIHEVGEHDDRQYFSMDYVEGRNLAEAVREHPWSAERAARCLVCVSRAVEHAHQQGIVHRDLKPSNIILDEQGEPHLTDFGLATQIEGASALTLSGVILGTPSYMAPEQTGGRRSEIGPRTDVYALGAILYEVVTGRPPFQGETPLDTLKMARETEVVPPRRLNPRLPADLETICLKCLEKECNRRYPSAGAVADDLDRFLRHEPIRARPAGPWDQALKWIRRNPWRAALAGAAGILLAVGLGLAVAVENNRVLGGLNRELLDLNRALAEEKALGEQTQQLLQKALITEQEAREAEARQRRLAETARDETRLLDYVHRIAMAHRAWEGNDLALAEDLLVGCATEHRHWEWHYLWSLCRSDLGVQARFTELTNQLVQARFSPDGALAAAIDERGRVQQLALRRGTSAVYPDLQTRSATALAFAAKQPWLAVAGYQRSGDADVTIVHTETTNLLWRFGTPWTSPRAMAFAAHDTTLLTASYGGLAAWDAAGGTRRWEARAPRGHEALDVSMDRDQPWVVWISAPTPRVGGDLAREAPDTSMIHIAELETGREAMAIPVAGPPIRSIHLGSDRGDGGVIFTGHSDGIVRLWNRSTGAQIHSVRQGFGNILSVAEASDGFALILSSSDGTLGFKRRSHKGDSPMEIFRGHRGAVLASCVESESSRALSLGTDGTVRQWSLLGPQDGLRVQAEGGAVAFLDEDRIVLPGGKVVESNGATIGPDVKASIGLRRVSVTPNASWISWGHSVSAWPAPGTNATTWIPVRKHIHQIPTAFSHDGTLLALGGRLGDAGIPLLAQIFSVPLWDHVGGVSRSSSEGFSFDLAFTPDDAMLAIAAGAHGGAVPGRVELWDWRAPRLIRGFSTPRFCPWTVAVSPDGRKIASGGGYLMPSGGPSAQPVRPHGEVLVWDLESGERLFSLPGVSESANTVRFSPDGQRLTAAIGAYRFPSTESRPPGEVLLWEMRRGLPLLTLKGFPAPVTGVAFSPSGRRLAAIGSGVLRVFNAPTFGHPATATTDPPVAVTLGD